jgi:DNA-binding LytR/AlgR family response regulator
MSDAIKEVSNINGARIHRSHWVAQSHLIDIEKDKARHLAVLSDGRKLPVSNTYLPQVQEMLKANI